MSRKSIWCRWFGIGCPREEPPPAPTPPLADAPSRSDLIYCYYGVQPGDLPTIAMHTNMIHIGAWGDWVNGRPLLMQTIRGFANEAVAAGAKRLMFTMDWCLYTQTTPRHLLPEATAFAYLTQFFDMIIEAGLRPYVHALYPIDEPNINTNALSGPDVDSANNLLRNVAAAYGIKVPLVCIYGSGGNYPGMGSYDWVGFDNYGANIFGNGEYAGLGTRLMPGQKTVIVPGGNDPWREDPWQFYNKAQTSPEVAMIMPFKWFSSAGGSDGIDKNGMAPIYTSVGLKIKRANP